MPLSSVSDPVRMLTFANFSGSHVSECIGIARAELRKAKPENCAVRTLLKPDMTGC